MNVQHQMWVLFEIATNLFQGFLVVYFLHHVLDRKQVSLWWGVVCGFSFAFCCSLYIFFPMPEIDTWMFCVPLLYSFVCFQNTFWQKLFWNVVLVAVFLGITNLSYLLAQGLFGISIEYLSAYTALRLLFVFTNNIMLFLTFYIILHIKENQLEHPLPLLLFSLLNLLSILIIDSLYIVIVSAKEYAFRLIFSSVMALSISIISVFLYIIMSKYARQVFEAKLKEQQLQMEAERGDELHSLYTSLSTLQHDIKHHLHIAAALAKEDNALESSQYLQEIESSIFSLFSTGCPALDSALTIKELEMHRKGITFHHEICFLSDLPIRVYEICSIVSNLLDNAIDAYEYFPKGSEEYVITLTIRHMRGMLCIECKNPVNAAALRIEQGNFLTTKQGTQHGIGISSIQSIVDSAMGNYSFAVDGKDFVVFLAIPYMTKEELENAKTINLFKAIPHK